MFYLLRPEETLKMVSYEILEDTTVSSCEESFLYERWFLSLLRIKHIHLVVTFVRTLTIRKRRLREQAYTYIVCLQRFM